MGEHQVEPEVPEVPTEELEVPVEEGEKYDGGDIPRSEPTEQEA